MGELTPFDCLTQAAARRGLDIDDVRRIRWATLAPTTLPDCPEFLRKLRRVLVGAESKWPGILTDFAIASWPYLLGELETAAQSLNFPSIPAEERHIASDPKYIGMRQRHAIYASFLALPDEQTVYTWQADRLMSHVFCAHLMILRIAPGTEILGGLVKGDTSIQAFESYTGLAPWPALTIQPKNVGLALRGLFSGEEWAREMIMRFPVALCPGEFATSDMFEIDSSLLRWDKSEAWLKYIRRYVEHYIAQAYGEKPRHRGHGKNPGDAKASKQPSAGVSSQISDQKNNDPGTAGSAGDVHEDGQGSDREYHDFCRRHDVCPDEDDDGYETDPPENSNGTGDDFESDQAQPPGNRRRRGRAGAGSHRGTSGGVGTDQAIKSNKYLAFSEGRLSPSELAPIDVDCRRRAQGILTELSQLATPRPSVGEAQPTNQLELYEELELLLFVLVMLWTGSGIGRTKMTRLSTSMEFKGAVPLAILIKPASNGEHAVIRVFVTFPPDAPRCEELPPRDRKRDDYVLLNDAAELGPLLWQFNNVLRGPLANAPADEGLEVFLRPLEYYRESVPRLLQELDQYDRLTETNLSSWLYDELMSWTPRDVSAVTMITGDYREKARTQMFYGVRRMDRLQERYTGAVLYLRNLVNLTILPLTESGQIVEHLAFLNRFARKAVIPKSFVPAPQNAPHVGINVCPTDGAMRQAVQDLIAELEGHWQLSDEEQWAEYHNLYTFYAIWFFGFVTSARPIECPYLRLEEICALNSSAHFEDKGKAKARLVWITESLLQQMKFYDAYLRAARLGSRTEYPCWFVGKNGEPVVVQPSTCEPYLQKFLPGFPSNIHRRWMFNALLDSGCPVVPEWAGHFLVGNQLTGRSGTASPLEVGMVLTNYIQPIMDFLGFHPIPARCM